MSRFFHLKTEVKLFQNLRAKYSQPTAFPVMLLSTSILQPQLTNDQIEPSSLTSQSLRFLHRLGLQVLSIQTHIHVEPITLLKSLCDTFRTRL